MTIPRESTQQNYDRMSRWYDLFAASEKKFTKTGLQILGLKAGEGALEIGFGTGHALIKMAQDAGNSGLVAGVELSPGMIEMAQKRIQNEGAGSCVHMIQGDGTFLPFATETFDVLFLSFTLELFSDAEIPTVLGECHRVLKQGGRLGVVSLAKRDTLACHIYEWAHEQWPVTLDCRPINVRESLETGGFRVQAAKVQTMWGLPVEIALGRPM